MFVKYFIEFSPYLEFCWLHTHTHTHTHTWQWLHIWQEYQRSFLQLWCSSICCPEWL